MTDSSLPSEQLSASPAPPQKTTTWRLNLALFVATTLSVFWAGAAYSADSNTALPTSLRDFLRFYLSGWSFAVPLLTILLCHEFGHWIAARRHHVPASLPYFLPLPFIGTFGTLGAVITMPERIRSRNALLDIGAAGPLAGLIVAIPVLIIGLLKSQVGPLPLHYAQEGQSLLYALLKRLTVGKIPDGYDVMLHPTAMAGWAGLLITMINLLPWGQLDGGHIAFALFGPRHNRVARYLRMLLLVPFAYNLLHFIGPIVQGRSTTSIGVAISNSLFWLMWFIFTGVLGRFFGKEHPPYEAGPLTTCRKVIASLCLLCFVLLFMPVPFAVY